LKTKKYGRFQYGRSIVNYFSMGRSLRGSSLFQYGKVTTR
jgi:hypothetical protein